MCARKSSDPTAQLPLGQDHRALPQNRSPRARHRGNIWIAAAELVVPLCIVRHDHQSSAEAEREKGKNQEEEVVRRRKIMGTYCSMVP